MTRSDFDKLSIKGKGKIVLLEVGKFIGHRNYYNQKLVLYDMGDFFAEVWYEPNQNQIREIISLPLDDKKINLYIQQNKNS